MRYLPLSQPLNLARLPLAVAVSFAFSGAAFAGSITETTSFEYDPVTGFRTAVVQEPDNPQLNLRTSFTYDSFGNRLTTNVSSTATGSAAFVARSTETLAYDATHPVMPTSSTNALGQTVPFGFDMMNMPAYINGLNNIKTTFVYDRFGRKKTEKNEVTGIVANWNYGVCGKDSVDVNDATVVCPARARYFTGKKVLPPLSSLPIEPPVYTFYDEAGRVVRTLTVGFDGVSKITQDTEYDNLGRVARVSRPYYPNASIQWATNTFDALGRLVLTNTPDNRQIKTSYNGLSTTLTNPLNQNRTSVLNSAGQLVQVIDHQNNAISYKYDAQGNLVQTIDPKGNTVSINYDARGRKTSIVDPDQGTVRFEYDALGQMLKQTDAKNNVTTFIYDKLGRSTKRTEADLVSTWTYDCNGARGKLCSATADNGFNVNYSYDALVRPEVTSTTVDAAYSTTTTYDGNGRVATQSYPSGLKLKYVYTSLGYLSEVRNNATNKLYWKANARDAEGHLTQQTYGNNVVTNQIFDPANGRVTAIQAGANNGVQNLSFTYDARGNMFTRNDANQSLAESFLYDTLNRLTSNTVNSTGVGQLTQSYAYDNIGDITSRSDMGSYTYGAVNSQPHAVKEIALAVGGKRQYTYDANGNLTQEVQRDALGNVVAAKGRTTTWTSFNMPLAITTPSSSASFVYGPDHQRIKQITPTGTTIFMHPDNAGGLLYEKETKSNGTIEHRHFITAGDGVVAMVKQIGTASTTAATLYMHRDHLGSTTAITNDAGTVVERMAYEPFGKRRTPAGALDPNNAIVGVNTDRGYSNHEELDALGLIHMNGRVYDPTIGRFISADPTNANPANIESYNKYSYVHNNPLIATDPTGFRICVEKFEDFGYSCAANSHSPEANLSAGVSSFTGSDFQSDLIWGPAEGSSSPAQSSSSGANEVSSNGTSTGAESGGANPPVTQHRECLCKDPHPATGVTNIGSGTAVAVVPEQVADGLKAVGNLISTADSLTVSGGIYVFQGSVVLSKDWDIFFTGSVVGQGNPQDYLKKFGLSGSLDFIDNGTSLTSTERRDTISGAQANITGCFWVCLGQSYSQQTSGPSQVTKIVKTTSVGAGSPGISGSTGGTTFLFNVGDAFNSIRKTIYSWF